MTVSTLIVFLSFTNGLGIKISNHKLEINTKEDTLIVSSSVTIGEVVNKISKRGYTLFNIPSHPEITIGGAIANNTHGKNQFLYKNFGDNVIEIDLYYNNSIEKISPPNCSKIIDYLRNFDLFIAAMETKTLLENTGKFHGCGHRDYKRAKPEQGLKQSI